MLILDKVDSWVKKKKKEKLLEKKTIIKRSTYQEGVTVLYVHAPSNNRASKH